MNKDNKEEPKVIYVKVDNNDDSKKKRRLIAAIILCFVLVIDIVLALIFIPKFLNKNNTTESSYVMDENTSTRYENLLSYINKERTDVSKSEMDKIVSLEFINNKLEISLKNEESPSYIEIKLPNDIESSSDALSIFNKGISLGKYETIIYDEQYSVKELNTKDKQSVNGIVSTTGVEDFVSFTTADNYSLISASHKTYNDDGLYDYTSVTEKGDKVTYDFYYYILNL